MILQLTNLHGWSARTNDSSRYFVHIVPVDGGVVSKRVKERRDVFIQRRSQRHAVLPARLVFDNLFAKRSISAIVTRSTFVHLS